MSEQQRKMSELQILWPKQFFFGDRAEENDVRCWMATVMYFSTGEGQKNNGGLTPQMFVIYFVTGCYY